MKLEFDDETDDDEGSKTDRLPSHSDAFKAKAED